MEVILDKSQRMERIQLGYIDEFKILTFIDDAHGITHDKIMIIDRQTVITGSFNFTKAAEEKNAENLLIIQSPELAKASNIRIVGIHREHRNHNNAQQ